MTYIIVDSDSLLTFWEKVKDNEDVADFINGNYEKFLRRIGASDRYGEI